LTVEEAKEGFLGGAAFSVVGGKVTEVTGKAVGGIINRAAPSVAEATSKGAGKVVSRVAGRAGVNAALSGGVSYAASGGDVEAAKKGAIFGAALSVALEPAGPLIAKASDRVFGTPARQLQGIKEVEFQTTQGQETVVTRFTQPKISETRLSGKALKNYNELASLARNIKMELAGTEKVTTIAPNEEGVLVPTTKTMNLPSEVRLTKNITGSKIEVVPERPITNLPTETTRSAEPLLSAVKGEKLQAAKIKIGNASEFLDTPSMTSAVEIVKIKTGQVNLTQSSGNKIIDSIKGRFVKDQSTVILEKTVITSKDAILPNSKTTVREFTGIKLSGQVDPLANLKAAKALPQEYADQIYKSLGGGSKPIIEKLGSPKELTGAMKPLRGSKGSVEPGANIEAQFKASQAKVKEGLSLQEYNKITRGSSAMKKGTNEFFRQDIITEGSNRISQQSSVAKQTVTFERPIIEVTPTKGSAWAGVATATVWGSQRAAQRGKQETQSMGYTAQAPKITPPTQSVTSGGSRVDMPRITIPLTTGKTDVVVRIPRPGTTPKPIFGGGPTDITIPIIVDVNETPKPITDGGPTDITIPKIYDYSITRTPPPPQPDIVIPATVAIPQNTFPKRRLQSPVIYPGGGSGGMGSGFSNRRGKWWKTRNALPNPDQVFKQVLGKKSIDVFKQTKQQRRSSSKRSKGKR
jgi:hypothetical protein